ncbi:DsbE family thiol:disulfide interchange protein [Zavarzinia compransoris]|uniref:DsbE family thiol:disulfide interchange protein n=1 Tax=Zavarzinia compransoris TaxID=1264899 RepID=A0A317E630_9PROT|nr:DsbE family thiol:disulfide interchange protein [Zavarzinia compransoris]PWR22072.1 DsbE family thiol:disulfide interchange protein [Zavarzinia compransoris]TDP47186.1 cytochrome c biogenesis protein CcmG/thiol:disulfide interchange protein DsbE [Zavarzinia compransoris]
MARTRFLVAALPLAIVIGLGGIFYGRLGKNPSELPSALIGKPVPAFTLPGLDPQGPGLADADLRAGSVTVVNVFASWCAPCRIEHPLLTALAKVPGLRVVGIAYKDKVEATVKFLDELGNPFALVGADVSGRVAIDWGVYGVPETYLVTKSGEIAWKHVGPLTEDVIRGQMLPLAEKLMK